MVPFLSWQITLGEVQAGHVTYNIDVKALTLNNQWRLNYRFGKFREL
jgi:hypothetical protein